jgi:hypothetical protein
MPFAATPVALATLSPYINGYIVKFAPPQQLPRILRQRLQFARLAHDNSRPLGTPADVHGKSAWGSLLPALIAKLPLAYMHRRGRPVCGWN